MAFNVRKHLIKVQGGRFYLPVAARLVWFREEHPDWGIETRPLEFNVEKGYALFEATVFDAAGKLMAKGTKMETREGFHDFLEKAETGAIGRALAVCGYGTQFAPDLFEGNVVDSPMEPRAQERPSTSDRKNNCDSCGATITPSQHDFSRLRFGKPLCPNCQKQRTADQLKQAAVQVDADYAGEVEKNNGKHEAQDEQARKGQMAKPKES
jgi:hypothetical protein